MADTGAFIDTQDLATLNAVNSAIEEILTGKKWEFDLRNTGQLTLKARLDDVTISTTAGSSSTILGAKSGSGLTLSLGDVIGDFIPRILPDGIDEYANTSFRLATVGILYLNAILAAILETEFPTTNTNADCEIYYAEYILPDTVESVVRATYQEYPLTLRQVDPKASYPELFPRPHIEFGPPEIVSVGGFDVRTFSTVLSDQVTKPSMRLAVWPVPDDDYVIDFSYYYRHPELVEITDTLDGVTPNVVTLIVNLATSDMKVFYEKDYEALSIRSSTMKSSQDMWNSHGGSRSARKGVGSWDKAGRRGGVRRGFPGKSIGI